MRKLTNSFAVGEPEYGNRRPLEGTKLLLYGVNGAIYLTIVHCACSLDHF